jgi:hypothetical protein
MAGMDLNPYNLNNRTRTGIRGQDAVSNLSDHYAGKSNEILEEELSEDEKERKAARKKYFGLYGFESTKPQNEKKEEDEKEETNNNKKDYSLYFIGFGIVILIIILIAIFI